MKLYESIDIVPAGTTYFDHKSDAYIPLKMLKICAVSKVEDMKPLELGDVRQHPYGMAAVGTMQVRGGEIKDVLSYAAVKHFEEYDDTQMAVVGGVVTIPAAREFGLGSQTVEELLAVASTEQAVEQHRHEAFKAVCNEAGQKLFSKLGFVAAGFENGKVVMVKEI